MKKIIYLIAIAVPFQVIGQAADTLTLQDCYKQLEDSYPIACFIKIMRMWFYLKEQSGRKSKK